MAESLRPHGENICFSGEMEEINTLLN